MFVIYVLTKLHLSCSSVPCEQSLFMFKHIQCRQKVFTHSKTVIIYQQFIVHHSIFAKPKYSVPQPQVTESPPAHTQKHIVNRAPLPHPMHPEQSNLALAQPKNLKLE